MVMVVVVLVVVLIWVGGAKDGADAKLTPSWGCLVRSSWQFSKVATGSVSYSLRSCWKGCIVSRHVVALVLGQA